ncbi:MAG: hypothetical protein IPI32_11260 [Austwickia sp.]|nr:hypothetical protein [Austwickia sp.]MBK8435940.1 hypothetical protein [Austwickia sp.]MBK9101624.1 hypothetical protein [Austwickia sp.]
MSTEQRKPQTIHPPLVEVALDTERHVAAAGWDQPVRLFALVETVRLLEAEPALAAQLDSQATPESGALSAIEQEDLPHHEPLETFLAQLAWPPEVDGAALAVERIVLPPAAMAAVEPTLPDDEQQAAAILAEHPDRADVRLLAAVLRDGSATCLLRQRAHDADDQVAIGADIAPGLIEALTRSLLVD